LIKLKEYSMSKIILEGVLQTFDYKFNGRVYPISSFDKAYWDYVRILKVQSRKDKIKRLFDVF
jgi:hypothetical protein